MSHADQAATVKRMFVRPEQLAEIGKCRSALGRLRLVVPHQGNAGAMILRAEAAVANDARQEEIATG